MNCNKPITINPRAAPRGKVVSHANKIFLMTFQFAFLVTAPIPKIDPQETWVVETGTPNFKHQIPANLSLGLQ